MTRTVQIAIIGAGSAGLSALQEIRKRTDDFVLINDGPYGTTCARVGCMPSKVLIEVAKTYHHRERFSDMGIGGGDALALDGPAVMRYVRSLRDRYVKGTLRATDTLGARNVAGRARFVAPDTLEVNGERIKARRIIVATGSRPIVPEAWRSLGEAVLTSEDIFELERLPKRLAVIGLGGLGAELAQAAARLGAEVHAFEATETVAGLTDPEVSAMAVDCLRRDIHVHLGAPAELKAEPGGIRVRAGDTKVVVDKVLAALGRRPNLERLGLREIGAPLDAHEVPRFDPCTLRIGDLPIYIAGDANRDRPLLHEAADEGYIAARNALADADTPYARRAGLQIVFTDPDVAVIGVGRHRLQDRAHVVGSVDLAGQSRLRMTGDDRGRIRLYADAHGGELLGAELCAPQGEHLAHLLALAVQQRLTVFELLRMPWYHPVLEEALRVAVRDAARQIGKAPELALCEAAPLETIGPD